MPQIKTIYPTPKNQTGWLAAVRSFCLQCCGNSHNGVRGCTNTACVWWGMRLEPVQLTFLDKGFRSIFYQDIDNLIADIHGVFTAEYVKNAYAERFNGSRGPVHPNWWGSAIRTAARKYGAHYIETVKSTAAKRKGGTIGVWVKA